MDQPWFVRTSYSVVYVLVAVFLIRELFLKGKGKAKVDHIARPEAQSIVIHDPFDGSRIGCFDLD